MIYFEWIDLNDETFKRIERDGSNTSEEVLAVNTLGSMLVGRIKKQTNGC